MSLTVQKTELKKEIADLQEQFDAADTPQNIKDLLKGPLANAKKQLVDLEELEKREKKDDPAPASVVKKEKQQTQRAIKTAKQIVKKVKVAKKHKPHTASGKKSFKAIVAGNKKFAEMYAGKTERELASDAQRKAQRPGSRTSASGKTYREYRPDRSDLSGTKPYLALGGAVQLDDNFTGNLIEHRGNGVYVSLYYKNGKKVAKSELTDAERKNIRKVDVSGTYNGENLHEGKNTYWVGENKGEWFAYENPKESTKVPANISVRSIKADNKESAIEKAKWIFVHYGFAAGGPIGTGKNGYICFYKDKQVEVMADTSLQAQQTAAAHFKAKKQYDVSVVLAEKEGKQVTHLPLFKKGGETSEKYRAEVAATNENRWSNNGMEYDTQEEAKQWLDGLKNRWFGYNLARVVPVSTPYNQPVDMAKDELYQNFRKSYAYAKGGIPNNYAGKTAEQVWNEWEEPQRVHFIADHFRKQYTDSTRLEYASKDYRFIPAAIKNAISTHIDEGEYAAGGHTSQMNVNEARLVNFESMYNGKTEAYQSITQPNLYFYASKTDDDKFWMVTSEVEGFPATEAWDDWFADEETAMAIAKDLAENKDPNAEDFANGGILMIDKNADQPWERPFDTEAAFIGYAQAMASKAGHKEPINFSEAKELMEKLGYEIENYAAGGHLGDDPVWHLVGLNRPPANFTPAAASEFKKAITELQKEKPSTTSGGTLNNYYESASKAMTTLVQLISELLGIQNTNSGEATQVHALLQEVGIYNYKTGLLLNTDFLNKELDKRILKRGGALSNNDLDILKEIWTKGSDHRKLSFEDCNNLLAIIQRKYDFGGDVDDNDDIEVEEQRDEPIWDEDCFITDIVRGGYDVSCGGKFIKHFSEFDDALQAVLDWQEDNKYWPTIWQAGERGDYWPIDDKGNAIKYEKGGQANAGIISNKWVEGKDLAGKKYSYAYILGRNVIASTETDNIKGDIHFKDPDIVFILSKKELIDKEQGDRLASEMAKLFHADKEAMISAIANGNNFKHGGRILSAINRDRAYRSQEPWEQAYQRRTKPSDPHYNKYAAGGAIPNNYAGKTAEQVWDGWTVEQREHFLDDHGTRKFKGEAIKKWATTKYSDFGNNKFDILGLQIKQSLEDHISEGQYAKGGLLKDQQVSISSEKMEEHFKAIDTVAGKKLYTQLMNQINNIGKVVSETLGTADVDFGKKGIIERVPKSILQPLSFAAGGAIAKLAKDFVGHSNKALVVVCKSVGNPDFRQDPTKSISPQQFSAVNTLKEASEKCREYIKEWDLGGGNWIGGQVYDVDGKTVAWVSYNGKVWDNDWSGNEKHNEIIGDALTKSYYASGGRTTRGISRDRKFKSQQPHEQAYTRKTSPKNPTYKKKKSGKKKPNVKNLVKKYVKK